MRSEREREREIARSRYFALSRLVFESLIVVSMEEAECQVSLGHERERDETSKDNGSSCHANIKEREVGEFRNTVECEFYR